MQIKISKRCFIGSGGNVTAGQEIDVPDAKAAKLIRAGFAEPVKSKAKRAPKKSNRSVGLANSPAQIETPSAE